MAINVTKSQSTVTHHHTTTSNLLNASSASVASSADLIRWLSELVFEQEVTEKTEEVVILHSVPSVLSCAKQFPPRTPISPNN